MKFTEKCIRASSLEFSDSIDKLVKFAISKRQSRPGNYTSVSILSYQNSVGSKVHLQVFSVLSRFCVEPNLVSRNV